MEPLAPPDTTARRILVAEDDDASRTLLRTVLNRNGYSVVETTNGAEAWRALVSPEGPRFAIVDWVMPELDGPSLIRRVRAVEQTVAPEEEALGRVYLILLTAKSNKGDIVAGLEAGADDYLTKPFHAGELLARVAVGGRILDLQRRLYARMQELAESAAHIRTLQQMLPICSYCKNIRDDQGYWNQVDEYLTTHSDAQFTHSICPVCLEKHFPAAPPDGGKG